MLLLLNLFIITVSIAEALLAPKRFYHYEKYTKLDTLRLPNDTKPLAYDIYLETNIHKGVFDFKGVVNITLEAVENTDEITLHIDDLKEVRTQLIEKESEQELIGLTYNYDKAHQRMTIFSEPDPFELKKGNHYVLTISYRGKLGRAANGFYRSYYKDRDGNVVWLASTHFEPTYARKAFPCYDEPALKANFTVTIAHGSNYSALSNMPLDGEPVEIGDDMIVSKFKTTPSISTYNIAFVVTNYKTIEDTYDNITHRIHSPLAAQNNGEYALINSIAILTALEEYFSIKYPFEKIDHITVPDHEAIAMENWGLIIYRFGNLLPYSKNSEIDNAKIVNVIAHELSHQWFGNLVTNEWWSLAWLNEALATYYGLKTLNAIKPSGKAWNYYFINLVGFVSLGDYDNQPLTHYVESRDDLNERFSPSTYYKGAHMLYMLEHALTENTMRKGISNYLKKYQHSTADEEDLFEELQTAATADNIPLFSEIGTIKKILTPWTHQRKYPIILATRDYESGSVHLRQLSYDVYLDDAKVQKYWYIPVAMATETEPNFKNTRPDFIFPNTENFTLNPSEINRTLQENDWLILNKDQIGLFRVNYDKRNWELIIKALKENPKSISPMTKAQLIRDCVFLSSHKKVSSNILVSLLSYLKVEDDIEPWLEAIPEMLYYIMFNKADEELHYVKYFINDIIEHSFKNAFDNLNETNFLLEHFRQSLLELACGVGSHLCEEFVKDNINIIMTNGPMEPELKRIVYEEICKTATEEEKKVLEGLPKLDPNRPEYESPAENLFYGTCKL